MDNSKGKENGAKFIVIDPAETPAAKAYMACPKPAMQQFAMIHVIIEEDLYDRNFVENWTSG